MEKQEYILEVEEHTDFGIKYKKGDSIFVDAATARYLEEKQLAKPKVKFPKTDGKAVKE